MKKIRISLFPLIVLTLLAFVSAKQQGPPKEDPAQKKWVDSVFNSLSPDHRLGQLFTIAAYSNKDLKHVKEIADLVRDYNIGGLIWMQGGPVRQAKLANYYQSLAKTPILYSMDAEWGLSMRLDSTPRYPRQMTLGAIENDSLIYLMGKQVAADFKRMGMHVNFAPVADVNNNPLNPVIGMRSFGEDKFKVARKAAMYMQGMQDEGIIANGKHFPGHGDTDSDSHAMLPTIGHSVERLDSLELYPFRYLFKRGLQSVMVAHLNIPSLDTTKNLPSTLSPNIVNDLLRKKMNYQGLIYTDALNMKGITDHFGPGEMDVRALIAGNDILLFSPDVPKAIEMIRQAVKENKLSQDQLDESCRKVLRAKYWCGLRGKQEIVSRNLSAEINSPQSAEINERLAEAAITLLKNDNRFLPLRGADSLRLLEVSFGVEEENTLFQTIRNYAYAEHVGLSHTAGAQQIAGLFKKIETSDIVIMQVNKTTVKADNNYGVGTRTLRLMDSIAALRPSVLVVLTNPYLLNKIPSVEKFRAVVLGYEYMPSILRASANAIMGYSKVNGKLPVSTTLFAGGSGITLQARDAVAPKGTVREKYYLKKFGQVDSLALAGINAQAYPGCQIVAMKDGAVIYQKSFGKQTYNRDAREITDGTLYDLASITKIASSSLALMKLRSEGKFDYSKKLGDYLPELAGTDKANLVIEDVLSHQAGLQAWIPFYNSTLEKNSDFKKEYYSGKRSDEFPIQVAKDLWAVKGLEDTIYRQLIASKIKDPGKYLYSDLGYYFIQKIIEKESGQKLNEYVHDIYSKLGITLSYHPLKYFSKLQIAPTENDSKFRKQVVHGYVHDPGAALLGGVAGHAGLFGSATDVAKLMQLFLNKGEYNGIRIIDSNVVKEFTSCRFCPGNRRGLCFEKPEPDQKKPSPVVADCSAESFGHSGFTGTFAWADPKNNLVVVFLSNRVFPSADDNKLTTLGIRGKVHKAFYDALNK